MAARLAATPPMRREPIASTRACSTASKIARAVLAAGRELAMHRRIMAGEPQRNRVGVAAHDAPPRDRSSRRAGSGSRTLRRPGDRPGRSAA